VWNALPFENEVYHARWAGREVFSLLPSFAEDPGEENATIFPSPGDLLFLTVPPSSIHIPPERRTGRPFFDIAFFYGRGGQLVLSPSGPLPGNLFAVITENLPDLAEACESIWRDSIGETMIIRRAGA
jgi:hypothetical protein